MRKARARRQSRRGIIVVLAAVIMIVLLGLVALAIDSGYMVLVRSELQNAADSAALAAASNLEDPAAARDTAQEFAAYHSAGARDWPVVLGDSDVQFGMWDADARTFTSTNDNAGTAVKVTAKRNDSTGGNHMFFGWVFGRESFNIQASAIAMGQPRDICLVVDLSGSMNDDVETGYSGTGTLTGTYASIRTQMMRDLYTDFNFGTYPGTQHSVGQPLGVSTYSSLSSTSGPLRSSSIPTTYRIGSSDSSSTRKTKSYRWMIDYQIASIMPNARPVPLSSNTASYNYWSAYLDAVTGQSSSNQNIGYRTYTQYMMDNGRDLRPDGTNYTQLSTASPNCPRHNETVDGETFSFPPREQPTHSCRRSLISAIQEIRTRNQNVTDTNQRDWVSIVTFDTVAGTTVAYPLSGNYNSAMSVCASLQACNDVTSTATESGMLTAYNHLRPTNEGGSGRISSQKVVVLLTDGMPNLKTSSNSTVSSYRSAHPSGDFYGGSSNYYHDAALMQSSIMQGKHWKNFNVGVGLDADYNFLDRMSRMGATADDDGQAPRTSGDPSEYESELRAIFRQIINTPTVRLVQ